MVALTAEVEAGAGREGLCAARSNPDAHSNGAAAADVTSRQWAITTAASTAELATQVSDLAAQAAHHTTELEVQMISLAEAAQRLIQA